jgi:hypothetical protein
LEDFEGNKAYAKYSSFNVHLESELFRMEVSGYNGDAGYSLRTINGMAFSTKDRDNDQYSDSCSRGRNGAWWYSKCGASNLNGYYYNGTYSPGDESGIIWFHWKGWYYSLKTVEMKIR